VGGSPEDLERFGLEGLFSRSLIPDCIIMRRPMSF
jgi:hypothetical protein